MGSWGSLSIVALLTVAMILTCLPATVNAEELPSVENWPVFRPGEMSSFVEPSMAVDDDGNVHLAYAYDPTPGDEHWDTGSYVYSVLLRYAVLTNSTWVHSDLGEEKWIQSVTMAVGENGEPHIVCLQQANLTTWELVHWYRSNGTWDSETIRTFSHLGITDINMLVGPEGSVHLAFSVSQDDFTYKTHVHMTNTGGNWTTDEIVTVRSSHSVWTNPPQLAFDDEGRLHMAYLNVTEYDIEDWYSGNHSIEFVTLENGTWGDRHVLNVGKLNRFSFGVDTDGYESVIYQQTDHIWSSGGKVHLAMRYDFGWSHKPYDEDGTSYCKLIMDGDQENMVIMHGNFLSRLEYYPNGPVENPLSTPGGMSVRTTEFVAGTWDHLVLLFYDSLTQGYVVSKPGAHMELVPSTIQLHHEQLLVRLFWDPVDPYIAERCVLYRSGGVSFAQPLDSDKFVDDTLDEDSWRQTYHYRLSVITPDGEEYVGPMAEIWIKPGSNPWALFNVLLAVLVVVSITFVILWFFRREKLTR